eukprot:c24438_g1_i1 orf=280-747(+)
MSSRARDHTQFKEVISRLNISEDKPPQGKDTFSSENIPRFQEAALGAKTSAVKPVCETPEVNVVLNTESLHTEAEGIQQLSDLEDNRLPQIDSIVTGSSQEDSNLNESSSLDTAGVLPFCESSGSLKNNSPPHAVPPPQHVQTQKTKCLFSYQLC